MSIETARALRRSMTDAEQRLWHHLKNRQLDGFKFRRQHPTGRYVLDFYCDDAKLAIELDGGQHADPARAAHDDERTRWLAREGVRVVRFWNNDVLTNTEGVLELVRSALAEAPSPRPSPAEAGEGRVRVSPREWT